MQKDSVLGEFESEGLFRFEMRLKEDSDGSDTSVTVKITNDTDKDIECGSDFT